MYNYPNKKKLSDHNNNSSVQAKSSFFGLEKKGAKLEQLINQSNEYYADKQIAFIYKKPTPIKVNKVKSINNFGIKSHVISEAYFTEKSTTDYNGLYKGYYIDFEAKQTKYKTFNLTANLHSHQIDHLNNIHNNNGIAFLIVFFYQYDKIFLIEFSQLKEQLKLKKSLITISFFEKYGFEIKQQLHPALDYIKTIDLILEKRRKKDEEKK